MQQKGSNLTVCKHIGRHCIITNLSKPLFFLKKQFVFTAKTICFCRENKMKSAGFFFLLIFYKYDVYIKSISYFCTIKSKLKIFYYY